MTRSYAMLGIVLAAACQGSPLASDAPGVEDSDTTTPGGQDTDVAATDTDADTDPVGSTDTDGALDTDVAGDTDVVLDTDPSSDTDLPDPPRPYWTLYDPIVCADPSLRTTEPFVAYDPAGDWQDQDLVPNAPPLFSGGGITVTDLDDDGIVDILRTSSEGDPHWLTLEAGGSFDRTAELGPLPYQTSAFIPVDFDGDGDLDLHVIAWQDHDLLLRQDPGGVWVDVAADLGIQGPLLDDSVSAAWADADGDGDLDVFVAAYGPLGRSDHLADGHPSHMYIQQDDGTFIDAVLPLPIDEMLRYAHTFQGVWMEIDGDTTAPELYVVNDFGNIWPNHAYKVVNNALVRLPNFGLEGANTCMGVALGDLSDDAIDDIALTTLGTIDTFVSVSGNWYRTVGIGLTPTRTVGQVVGWGAELEDYDNDGDLDLYTGFGQLDPNILSGNPPWEQSDGMWRNDGGHFVDIAGSVGLAHTGVTRGLLAVDLNQDGWLDVVRQDLAGPATVDFARCGAEAWLEVELRDPTSENTRAIGARIDVYAGTRHWSRTVRAGGRSFESAAPFQVHFGLGSLARVDRIEVLWPDGGLDVLENVGTRRQVRVDR